MKKLTLEIKEKPASHHLCVSNWTKSPFSTLKFDQQNQHHIFFPKNMQTFYHFLKHFVAIHDYFIQRQKKKQKN